jgi:predicted XRE-type DNA-binding protein
MLMVTSSQNFLIEICAPPRRPAAAPPSRLIGGSIFRQLGRKSQREKSGKYRAVIVPQLDWLCEISHKYATMTKISAAKDPTRNVWLQLGFPDAEEHYLKAELVLRLDKAIKTLGLTQRVVARRIGTTQPELSKILGGKFTEVSLERLMRFLTALGYHIEIKIGTGRTREAGKVTIRDARRTAA